MDALATVCVAYSPNLITSVMSETKTPSTCKQKKKFETRRKHETKKFVYRTPIDI